MKKKNNIRQSRGGHAVVETALMLPLLVIATFGAIDIAQYINAGQVIGNAAREGARIASRNETNDSQTVINSVEDYIDRSLANLSDEQKQQHLQVHVFTKAQEDDPESASTGFEGIETGETIVVQVNFDFAAVRWLSGPSYSRLKSKSYCRRE